MNKLTGFRTDTIEIGATGKVSGPSTAEGSTSPVEQGGFSVKSYRRMGKEWGLPHGARRASVAHGVSHQRIDTGRRRVLGSQTIQISQEDGV